MEHGASSKPQETPKPADTYMKVFPFVSAAYRLKYHFDVEGEERIPKGPSMLVANHLRFDDSVIIAAIFAKHTGRPLRLGAKSEYFEGAGINNKGRLGKTMKKFVESTRQLPVHREDNARGTAALAKAIKERFADGDSVLLHAEGTRSLDGRMNKFKHGAAAFAIKNAVPIVPVGISYDRPHHLRTHAHVTFGEPLVPHGYGMETHHIPMIPDSVMESIEPRIMNQRERTDKVTHVLEDRVAELSGQEQSGFYLDPYKKVYYLPATKAAK